MQHNSFAQSSSDLSFTVATIKPGKNVTQNGQKPYDGGYSAKDVTVKDLILFAYNVPFGQDDLVSGGPKWAYSDTFDIEAKADNDIEAKTRPVLTRNDFTSVDRVMVRKLLEDRFYLKVHHEPKQVQGFSLILTDSGRKLMPSKVVSVSPINQDKEYAFGANLPKPQSGPPRMRLTPGDMHTPQASMTWLTGYLQFQPETEGHRIIDKTGLVGEFDISLKWRSERSQPADSTKDDPESPNLFTALQQQLGLRLERTKTQADSIVVDDIRRPSEN